MGTNVKAQTPSGKNTPKKAVQNVDSAAAASRKRKSISTPQLDKKKVAKIDLESESESSAKKQVKTKSIVTTATEAAKNIETLSKSSTPIAATENDNLDPKTFVSQAKLAESLRAVRVLQACHESKQGAKRTLFESENKFVHLQVELKKIPTNYTTFIHEIELPEHWRHSAPTYDTCLIVPDANREPLDDRDADLEASKTKYVDLLEAADATALVKDILPLRQLRNEFRPNQLKHKLSNEYCAFLCERRLFRNKFCFLSRFLGKPFWIDHRKVPLMIDFAATPVEGLKRTIEARLNVAQLYASGKGSSLAICIGSLAQKPESLLRNLVAVLERIQTIFGDNIRALSVKGARSLAVTFFMDLGSANSIKLPAKRFSKIEQQDGVEQQDNYVQDEFDFLTNANIRVYRDGRVRILHGKKSEKTSANEDDETSEAVDPDDDDEEEEEEVGEEEPISIEEREFIRSINRTEEPDWIRHKVGNWQALRRRKVGNFAAKLRSKRGKRFSRNRTVNAGNKNQQPKQEKIISE